MSDYELIKKGYSMELIYQVNLAKSALSLQGITKRNLTQHKNRSAVKVLCETVTSHPILLKARVSLNKEF
jgi:hypothetical protein